MILIKLPTGESTFIDEIDKDLIKTNWHACPRKHTTYVQRRDRKSSVMIHRVILSRMMGRNLGRNEFVDHIDRCGLNNCRSNLRLVSAHENCHNQRKIAMRGNKQTSSIYKGVCWDTYKGRWRAQIVINRRRIHLGYFRNEILAAKSFDNAAKRYVGECANLNFP